MNLEPSQLSLFSFIHLSAGLIHLQVHKKLMLWQPNTRKTLEHKQTQRKP